jgi:hypothetical protein
MKEEEKENKDMQTSASFASLIASCPAFSLYFHLENLLPIATDFISKAFCSACSPQCHDVPTRIFHHLIMFRDGLARQIRLSSSICPLRGPEFTPDIETRLGLRCHVPVLVYWPTSKPMGLAFLEWDWRQ